MAEFNGATAERIIQTCKDNTVAITQSFNATFSQKFNLVFGPLITGGTNLIERVAEEPGVMVVIEVAGQAIGCLIPESLPLPRWYREPNDTEKSRLQTLGMEWATTFLPTDIEATRYVTVPCSSIKRQVMACSLAEEGWLTEISVQSPMTSAEKCRLTVIWPLTTPRFQKVGEWPTQTELDAEQTSTESEPVNAQLRRVRQLPVQVSVRIAEKKADLRQIRAIRPGLLISFPKACEEPLDVYVGGQLFARGEAVKLGEHFAIKINETQSRVVREQRVHRL